MHVDATKARTLGASTPIQTEQKVPHDYKTARKSSQLCQGQKHDWRQAPLRTDGKSKRIEENKEDYKEQFQTWYIKR